MPVPFAVSWSAGGAAANFEASRHTDELNSTPLATVAVRQSAGVSGRQWVVSLTHTRH